MNPHGNLTTPPVADMVPTHNNLGWESQYPAQMAATGSRNPTPTSMPQVAATLPPPPAPHQQPPPPVDSRPEPKPEPQEASSQRWIVNDGGMLSPVR